MFVKLRDFAIGVVVGLATAVIIKEVSDRALPYKSADEVLAALKQQFKKDGHIEGSWVYMKPEQFENGYTSIPVYRGGITQIIDGESKTYEFVADAYQGILLEVTEV
jgi:predicted small secreted protein